MHERSSRSDSFLTSRRHWFHIRKYSSFISLLHDWLKVLTHSTKGSRLEHSLLVDSESASLPRYSFDQFHFIGLSELRCRCRHGRRYISKMPEKILRYPSPNIRSTNRDLRCVAEHVICIYPIWFDCVDIERHVIAVYVRCERELDPTWKCIYLVVFVCMAVPWSVRLCVLGLLSVVEQLPLIQWTWFQLFCPQRVTC